MRKTFRFLYTCILLTAVLSAKSQQNKVIKKENVVYGMVSNMALLMDVYQPEKNNKKAVVFIHGSAWGMSYPGGYDQRHLNDDFDSDSNYMGKWGHELVQRGYTLFVINHRFVPAFQFPEIFADCQRAVRFIRFHANDYDIDARHIGAMGHSSGANLAAMLGAVDGKMLNPSNRIDSTDAGVQAVVTLAAPFDLADVNKKQDSAMAKDYVLAALNGYLGGLPEKRADTFFLSGKYALASPITHLTKNDAPMLIYYSDNDPLIPARQAGAMYKKLVATGIAAKIVERKNQDHGPVPDMNEVDAWFKKYLQ